MTISRQAVKFLTDAYVVFVLILSTGAFVSLFVDFQNASDTAEGSPVFKTLWGLIYLITLYRLYKKRDDLVPLLARNKALIFQLFLILASWIWSIDRAATLHLGVTLILTTLIAIDIGMSYSVKRQVEMIAIALAFIMVCSVIAEVVFPGIIPGRALEGTAWHGVFPFKNDFGRLICLTVIACLGLSHRSTWLRIFTVVAGVGLGVLSQSASAVGYTVLLTLVFMTWSILKWKPVPRFFGIAFVTAVSMVTVAYVANNFARVMALADKDPHMTGRVDLWQYAIIDIKERPILGYGAGAFWNYDSQQARRIREAVNWDEAPHAHNAYIDYALSNGMVGLATFFVIYFVAFGRSFRLFMRGPENYRRWPITYLIFVLFYQATESGITASNSILWILFCTSTLSLSAPKDEDEMEEEEEPLAEAVAA